MSDSDLEIKQLLRLASASGTQVKWDFHICFHFLKEQLNEVIQIWNSHRIGPSRNQNVPSGRPLLMYSIPELYDQQDYLVPVCADDVEVCEEECIFRRFPCDEDVFHLCVEYQFESHFRQPLTPEEAVDLYLHLRECLHRDLRNVD